MRYYQFLKTMQKWLEYVRNFITRTLFAIFSRQQYRSYCLIIAIITTLVFVFAISLISFTSIADNHAWRMLFEAPGRVLARSVTFITGERPGTLVASPHNPGFLYIGAPQVYTRERLVNDRFRESDWLERMLDRAENASMTELPSRRQASGSISRIFTGESEDTVQATNSVREPLPETGVEAIRAFNRRSVLRERIRIAQMDAMLDDAHDLDGNTLYRFNFGATVVPHVGRNEYPGSAVFVLTAKKWEPKLDDDFDLQKSDNQELLVDLEKELQNFFHNAMIIQLDRFYSNGRLSSPHNAAEAQAFENFLMGKLKDLFKEAFVFVDGSVELKRSAQDLGETIAELEILRTMLREARRERISKHTKRGRSNQHTPCWGRLQGMVRNSRRPWFRNLFFNLREFLEPRGRSPVLGWLTEPNPEPPEQNLSGCNDDPFNLGGQLSRARLRGLVRLTAILEKADRDLGDLKPKQLIEEIQNQDRTKIWLEGELGTFFGNNLKFRMERENCSEQEEQEEQEEQKEQKEQDRAATLKLIGCMLRKHGATTEVQDLFAQFLQMRMADALNEYFFKSPLLPKASEYFDFKIIGCSTGQCRVRLDRKYGGESRIAKAAFEYAAKMLMKQLEYQRHHLEVYQISPRRLGTLVEALNATETSVGFGFDEIKSTFQRQATTNETFDEPLAIGFSDITTGSADKADNVFTHPLDETTFGWIVRPQRHPEVKVWRPENLHFSVILTVPSWWKRLELEISACWVSPRDTADLSKDVRENPMMVCEPSLSPTRPEKQQYKRRQYIVQLPRQLDEVRARFELDVLKAPYFDTDWVQKGASRIILEAGRPGAMVLVGERLWRSTEVILGGVRADRIRVLPDMKGIFAEFDCVPFPAGRYHVAEKWKPHAAVDQNGRVIFDKMPAVVWTSEGRTVGLNVRIARFTARTEDDTPCTTKAGSKQ